MDHDWIWSANPLGCIPSRGQNAKMLVSGSHLLHISIQYPFIWSLAYGRLIVSPITPIHKFKMEWPAGTMDHCFQDSFPPFLIGSGSAKTQDQCFFQEFVTRFLWRPYMANPVKWDIAIYHDIPQLYSMTQHDCPGFEKPPNQKMAYRSAGPQVGKT